MSNPNAQSGLVMIAVDPGDHLAELRHWCATVRTPAVLAVPGVASATEWQIVTSFLNSEGGGKIAGPPDPGYIVRYELDDIDIAHTDEFLDAIGRDFDLTIEIEGAPVAFDQFMWVTLAQIRDHVNPEAGTTPVGGMLVVSHSPERQYVNLYNDWMDDEHIDELMSCPGYLRTRRFKAVDGIPNFFAMYEIDGPDALNSPRMLSFSTRRDDQKPPLHQKIAKHMVETICDVYQRLD